MTERKRPFSNGTEFLDWTRDNCDRCVRTECALRDAFVRAYLTDGTVSADVARRTNRHEFRFDDDLRFCTEIQFSADDAVRYANWLALPKMSVVDASGRVLSSGRWPAKVRQQVLRNWSNARRNVRLVPFTQERP